MRATAVATTVLAFAGSAAAFVQPSAFNGKALQSATTSSTSLRMSDRPVREFEDMYGATAPLPYWDPAGFSTRVDEFELQKYREAEVKHGRVAMLACLGMVVQESFHPFFGMGAEPDSPAAFHLQEIIMHNSSVPALLVLGIAAVEGLTIGKGWSKQRYKEEGLGAGFVAQLKEDYFPGDLGFDPLNLYPASQQARADIRNKELNNGRLAMIAIWGMWAQELVDHMTLWDHYQAFGFGRGV